MESTLKTAISCYNESNQTNLLHCNYRSQSRQGIPKALSILRRVNRIHFFFAALVVMKNLQVREKKQTKTTTRLNLK